MRLWSNYGVNELEELLRCLSSFQLFEARVLGRGEAGAEIRWVAAGRCYISSCYLREAGPSFRSTGNGQQLR